MHGTHVMCLCGLNIVIGLNIFSYRVHMYFVCMDEVIIGSMFSNIDDAYTYSKRFSYAKQCQIYSFMNGIETLLIQYPVQMSAAPEIESHVIQRNESCIRYVQRHTSTGSSRSFMGLSVGV